MWDNHQYVKSLYRFEVLETLEHQTHIDLKRIHGNPGRSQVIIYLIHLPLRPCRPYKDTYFSTVLYLTEHGQSGLHIAAGLSRSCFLEQAASLIHDSCSHWWVCIICWLSACNIDTAWTIPLTLPLLLSPHTEVCLFVTSSGLIRDDDWVLFGKALAIMSLPVVFSQQIKIHAWI